MLTIRLSSTYIAAPGINGVISSVTIEALNSGCTVLGIYEGFKQLKQGREILIHYIAYTFLLT